MNRLPQLTAAVLAGIIAASAYRLGISGLAGVAATVGLLALAAVAGPNPARNILVSFGTARLTESDFCRHGIVVGQPGTGKTELFKRILIELTRHDRGFGGLITDEKGDLHLIVERVLHAQGASDKLIALQPRTAGANGTEPKHRMNLIGDRSISWQSHAQLLVDVAVSQGQKTSQAHFKIQAIDRMAEAMETIHLAGFVVTIPALHEFIKLPPLFDATLARMMDREFTNPDDRERAHALFDGWRQYQAKAPEELSGIRSTIENYTNAYLEAPISQVFCSVSPNVGIEALDQGKILLVSIPQEFARARKYIHAYCKILYYRDSLGRFDRAGSANFAKLNLHAGLFDEGHNSLLASEEGYSDFNTLDKMRSARCAAWFMMQCYSSALPSLESEAKLDVLKANLGTHVIFRLASEKGHKLAAGVIGEHEVLETSRSVTRGVTTISRTPKVKPVLGSWVFRKLRDFHAIVRHANDIHDFHRVHLPPLTDDGRRIASWYPRTWLDFGAL